MAKRGVAVVLLFGVLCGALVGCDRPSAAEPLFEAAKSGYPERCKALIAEGIDVNAVDSGGNTAIYWAVYHCHVDVVRALIEAGADVNHVSNAGYTPLVHTGWPLRGRRLLGTHSHRTEMARLLIAAGADVNHQVRRGTGQAALHFAAADKNASLVRLLIESGADVNVKEEHGWTPLDVARFPDYHPNEDVIRILEAARQR